MPYFWLAKYVRRHPTWRGAVVALLIHPLKKVFQPCNHIERKSLSDYLFVTHMGGVALREIMRGGALMKPVENYSDRHDL